MGAPSMRSWVARRSSAALALIAVLTLLGGCGSNQAKEKLALAADTTTTETKTVTEPPRTVTTPARTETKTVTEPGRTTIESHTTTVAVKPTTSTNGGESSGDIPAWGWVLIGAGVVLLAVAIFMIGRSHGKRRPDTGPTRPGPGSGWDQPQQPYRGPPEDPI